jgi:hypothetical protein
MKVRGVVERKRVARGSKSEHEAIVLRTPRRDYWLRRRGGHPFTDPALEPLVGQTLEAEGSAAGPSFILDRWKPAPTPKPPRARRPPKRKAAVKAKKPI